MCKKRSDLMRTFSSQLIKICEGNARLREHDMRFFEGERRTQRFTPETNECRRRYPHTSDSQISPVKSFFLGSCRRVFQDSEYFSLQVNW